MVFCNIAKNELTESAKQSHNPYFNRWFSAMYVERISKKQEKVTILILIDGFLQCSAGSGKTTLAKSQSLF